MGYTIVTRYHGPTDYRGSRIIGTGPAIHSGGPLTRATVAWDYGAGNGSGESDTTANHRRAAEAVAAKLRADGWHVTLTDPATLPDETGQVWPLAYNAEAN